MNTSEKLCLLADHVEKNAKRIRMESFFNACGTPACLGGWACSIPAFKRLGLEACSTKATLSQPKYHVPGDLVGYGLSALRVFFGITAEETVYLFGMQNPDSKRIMIARLREVAKRYKTSSLPLVLVSKVDFVWKGITFTVRLDGDRPVYRDAAHLGGPWSDVKRTVGNSALEKSFRKALAEAAQKLEDK